MINVMDAVKDPMKGIPEKWLDPQLWHACAGGMVQMPPVNSKVFYFPQGHAENASGHVDFGNLPLPPLIPCRVSAIKYMADVETDEVYAKIGLVPIKGGDFSYEDDVDLSGLNGITETEGSEKTPSFAKTLTQSDANNGGGFSVPRYCAETIFPKLDYNAEPPVQTILAKDVHGEVWKFRHIYRGTPRRHLLTTGWSNFVNHKKLVAGDSIVFMRAENGELCIGIRRAKRGLGNGPEYAAGWNPIGGNCSSQYSGYSTLLRDGETSLKKNCLGGDVKGKVRAESIIEAATMAATGRPFEVVYYPRASASEFCVKASAVRAAMQIQWCSGMRFKMAFETEDSSRISWFMGTVSAANVADPIRWPNSPWRLLQVAWDEPDLLQNVKRVSPWLVELVSNIPAVPLSPYAPPRKKMRLPQHPDLSLINSFPIPSLAGHPLRSSSPISCISDSIPVGLQGARQAHPYGLSSTDPHLKRLLPPGFSPIGFQSLGRAVAPTAGLFPINDSIINSGNSDTVSCLLTIGSPKQDLKEKIESKNPHIVLFGKIIPTEQENCKSCSDGTVDNGSSEAGNMEKTPVSSGGSNQNGVRENSSDQGSPCSKDRKKADFSSETGHCKVFVESEDVGRTLDLSVLKSYEELYGKLSDMFGVEMKGMLSSVIYRDEMGSIKHTGNEPFSEFSATARRLTIRTGQ